LTILFNIVKKELKVTHLYSSLNKIIM